MRISRPAYFDRFRCLGGSCPDSCCKDWEVQIDEDTARQYRALPGELGERLRQAMVREDGRTVMANCHGRCPMWRADGLCRIQAELGEQALSRVCREFPRLTHDYGDFVELGLELSCPEAARWILTEPAQPELYREVPGTETGDYDPLDMAVLRRTRARALALLEDRTYGVGETLALLLLYGCQAQAELDGGEEMPFQPEKALKEAAELAGPGTWEGLLEVFRGLEILTKAWEQRLNAPEPGDWQEEYRALAGYFVRRYWLQAVSDYDLYSRVKLAVISCLTVRALGGDLPGTAQLYSKEIENSPDNVEALLDGACTCPAFRDDLLLGLLLENR